MEFLKWLHSWQDNGMNIIQKSVTLADPHICSDAKNRFSIFNAIFDCLVKRDSAGRFIPALSTKWTVEPDAQQWTFALRNDVTFHNGDQMTAADVAAALKRACDPSVGGELGTEGVWASYLGDAEISVIDAHTVSITTSQPMADLLDLLVAIPIMPESVLSHVPTVFVGSGQWQLVEHDETQVRLARFEKSHINGAGGIAGDRLTFYGQSAEDVRIEALVAGRADLAADLSPQSYRAIQKADKQLLAQPSNLCVAFLCNASRGMCSHQEFRQALNYAVNVERMIEQAFGGVADAASRLNGPLTPFHYGCDDTIPPYPHDFDKARALLDKAGADSRIVIDLPMKLPDEAPLLGELLAEDLVAVGLDVSLRHFEDRPAYAHMVKEKRIDDACCFDSSPLSTYRVLREKFNSDVAGPWWQGYHNPQVNQLLDQASRTVDDIKRRAIYQRAYRHLHDDAPWIFLYHPTNYWAFREGVNVRANSEGVLIFS